MEEIRDLRAAAQELLAGYTLDLVLSALAEECDLWAAQAKVSEEAKAARAWGRHAELLRVLAVTVAQDEVS